MKYINFKTICMTALSAIVLPFIGAAQFSIGTGTYVSSGTTVFYSGNMQVTAAGSLTNNGTVNIQGDVDNAGTTAGTGTLLLNGTAAQSVTGSQIFNTGTLKLDNTAGLTLNNSVAVGTIATFTNGMITATAAPLIFNAGATSTGVTDANHVNGSVSYLGTGSFVYPVGNASKYQPIAANLTDNLSGMTANYVSASIIRSNTLTAPLTSYNSSETWDLTPNSSASGTVTVYWDSYHNSGINSAADVANLVVAHYTSSAWKSEGATGGTTGTFTSGTVTSGIISSWSPFTLGSINSTILPVTLTKFQVTKSGNTAVLTWNTATETNNKSFEVWHSTDQTNWKPLQSVNSKAPNGNSSTPHSYSYTDAVPASGINYYRLQQFDKDDNFVYSGTVSVDFGGFTKIYPSPASSILNVETNGAENYTLVNMIGQTVKTGNLVSGKNQVDISNLPSGTYVLSLQSGNSVTNNKIVIKK